MREAVDVFDLGLFTKRTEVSQGWFGAPIIRQGLGPNDFLGPFQTYYYTSYCSLVA